MADFNPDAYLATGSPKNGFNPDAYLKGPETAPKPAPYKSIILPMSIDEAGTPSLDWNAGITGAIKQAIMAPGEAYQGKFDPTSKEGIGRALGTALLISPISTAMRAGARAIPGGLMARTKEVKSVPGIPTAKELKSASKEGYKAAKNIGVEYGGSAIRSSIDDLERALAEDAHISANNPRTFALLNELKKAPEGSTIELKYVDALRKQLGNIAGDPVEGRAATIAIKHLDDFLENPNPASIVDRAATPRTDIMVGHNGGPEIPIAEGNTALADAMRAAKILKEARGNAAAGFRDKAIKKIQKSAELRSDAANSGANLGNTLRSKIASLLENDKKTRGFSPDEIAALEEIVKGTGLTNTTRYASKFLGGGGGLGQAIWAGMGAAAGGPAGAAAPVLTGMGLRAANNKLTAKQVTKLAEILRSRSPLYEKMKTEAPMVPVAPEQAGAIGAAARGAAMPNQDNSFRIDITPENMRRSIR